MESHRIRILLREKEILSKNRNRWKTIKQDPIKVSEEVPEEVTPQEQQISEELPKEETIQEVTISTEIPDEVEEEFLLPIIEPEIKEEDMIPEIPKEVTPNIETTDDIYV